MFVSALPLFEMLPQKRRDWKGFATKEVHMSFICYTAQNLPLLYLSPYATVSLENGKAVFSQLMFRRAMQLEGKPADLSECLEFLRSGIQYGDLARWGEKRFGGFHDWIERALRAGIIE